MMQQCRDGNRQEVNLDVYVSPCFSRFYDVLTSAQGGFNIDSYLLARSSTRASRRHARGARGHQCTSLSQLIQQRYFYTTPQSGQMTKIRPKISLHDVISRFLKATFSRFVSFPFPVSASAYIENLSNCCRLKQRVSKNKVHWAKFLNRHSSKSI